jgi:AraC-like DNA-binding protein
LKLKSRLLTCKKPIIVIERDDFYNSKNHFVEEKISIKNEKIEEIRSVNFISEDVLIMDIQMWFSNTQTIETKINGESVVMSFICSNNVEAYIDQVETEKYTTENTHNILYASNFNATFKIPSYEEINYLCIILSLDFYRKLINEDWELHQKFSKNIIKKKSAYLTPKYLPFNAEIQWVIHEIKSCKHKGGIKKMYLETKIKELLILQLETLIKKIPKTEHVEDEDFKKLLEAKLILEANFTNAPTLLELSRAISLNEFKLKKGFKACFATTVKSYVTKLRMEYAKNLFKSKDSNVGEIAYKCGYKDASHFSAAFKLFYGFTPASFRKVSGNAKFCLLYCDFLELFSIDLFMI